MKILYFTKCKPYTLLALQRMIQEGNQVSVVCKTMESFKKSKMHEWCVNNSIEYFEYEGIYNEEFLKTIDFDVAISNTFGKRIHKKIIEALKGKIFNLHCAPLPEYKGMFPYNWGIYHGEKQWKVTAHYVTELFDEGDIIKEVSFLIDSDKITVKELEEESQKQAFYLMFDVLRMFEKEKPVGQKQKGNGHYYSRKDFEQLKVILPEFSSDEIERRIRACYCPGYEGAYLLKESRKFPIYLSSL